MNIANPKELTIINSLPPLAEKGAKISGIYIISSKFDGKKYVGQSTEIYKRIQKHYSALYHNRHINKHLQSAWNLYGSSNFDFEILEYCNDGNLNDRERFYISKFKSMNPKFGYNLESGGNLKKSFSEHSRKRMSIAHIGVPTGRKGRKLSPEHAEKSRMARIGKKHTLESRLKISIANKGKGRKPGFTTPDNVKEKLRQSRLGQRLSDETKRKLSVSMKLVWKRKSNEHSKSKTS